MWYNVGSGSVAEWFKAHAWKACKRETVSEVRILSLPPEKINKDWRSFLFSLGESDT